MRIEPGQMIAGFPAVQIRQLMRETVGRPITLRWVREVLQCADATANSVLDDLQREGLVVAVNGHLEPSLKGSALAQATAAKPLVRRTAELLVSEVVARAKAINADNEWAYRVAMLVVFGSFVAGAARPNDVDVACKLEPRWQGEAQSEAEDERRLFSDRRFRNISECVVWPKLEVLRFLKSRSRGLSIQELNDWVLKQEKHKVVFQDGRRE
jgi:predicted nucleotidyltransferase